MSSTERTRKHRARMRAKGYVQVTVWVPAQYASRIKEYTCYLGDKADESRNDKAKNGG